MHQLSIASSSTKQHQRVQKRKESFLMDLLKSRENFPRRPPSDLPSCLVSKLGRANPNTIAEQLSSLSEVEKLLLIYFCCNNKLPWTHWFKTFQLYYLTVLEVRDWRRVHSRIMVSAGWPFFWRFFSNGHLSGPLSAVSLSYQGPLWLHRDNWMTQDNLPSQGQLISHLNPPLPRTPVHSQVLKK